MAEVFPAERLRGRFAGVDLDELVDGRVVRTWLYFGMVWLMLMPSVGVAISGLFTFPDYLGSEIALTFGRLRPVHVNGVIFGAFSALFIGECYYLLPRLCGVRVVWSQLGVPLAWVWNIAVLAGSSPCPLAKIMGSKQASFHSLPKSPSSSSWRRRPPNSWSMAIGQRLEPPLYVSLWYLIAAFVWTDSEPRRS